MDEEEMEISAVEDTFGDYPHDNAAQGLVDYVTERHERADDARYADEQRWLQAYRNYRGLYGPDVRFTDTEKSKVFVKVTKTKVLAAYGQVTEVLLGNNSFPITINPTKLPEGVEEAASFETNPQLQEMGLLPGETLLDQRERLGPLEEKLKEIENVKAGPSTSPTGVTVFPAMVAAKKMEKKIHDQLEESRAKKHLRSMGFELALFGTGVMKGPFVVDKEYANWTDEGEYDPTIKTRPQVSSVSIWNFFPDPDATTMEDCEYVVERHKMSKSQLRKLKSRPAFRSNEVDVALAGPMSYDKEWWEHVMEDDSIDPTVERYEVLEFWGNVDRETLEAYDVKIPKKFAKEEEINVNIWVCNGRCLRVAINPFTPVRIPYYIVPYEVNPYSIFGIGVAENMDDSQTLMNGFMRMAVDNAALSGNLIIEVDESNLVPGQDTKVYPGKVFRRQGGAPGQAIFGTKFPNVSQENMMMFDKSRQLSDESTGFPSFAHGQTGVQGVGRTASGISMLMSAANGSIRTVVKNVDDYLLAPMGKAMFSYNMQFDYDPEIKGDLEVKAAGTESLMANEVRSQRLMQFLGVVQNPALAPFAKMDYIIREIARSMDLDPDKVTNSMSEAAIQAEMLKGLAVAQGAEPPAGAQAADTQGSGGGTIGTGSVPTPGEPGFSGNVNEAQPQAPSQQQGPV